MGNGEAYISTNWVAGCLSARLARAELRPIGLDTLTPDKRLEFFQQAGIVTHLARPVFSL